MADASILYDYNPYNLYVNNLDETVDEQQLINAFSAYGTITSVKVMTDENLRSIGFGYVCFRSRMDATVAEAKMNNKILGSKRIYVSKARMKRLQDETTQNTTSPPNNTLGPQLFQPGGATYYVPFIPRTPRFYNPNQIPVRNNPRWPAQDQIRPRAQHAAGSPGMQQGEMTRPGIIPTVSWTQPASFRAMNPRPITGQQPTRAAMASRAAGMPPGTIPNTGSSPCSVSLPPNAVSQVPSQAVPIQGQEPLTLSKLASVSVPEQKQMLGDRLYPLIQHLCPDKTGKITGMLLEIDNSELLHLLEHPKSLKSKVEEAVAVLQDHQTKQVPSQAVPIPGQEPLTLSKLAYVSVPEQKQMLGERLFPLIEHLCQDKAGRITGMLLVLDNSVLLYMLEHTEYLKSKVEEAVAVLEDHLTKQVPSQAVSIQGQEPLTSSMLASVPAPEQKQMLGNRLFPLIQHLCPDRPGKITGMLLEIDNSELLHMLEHQESLKSKVEEAVAVLEAHLTKQVPGIPNEQ